MGTRPVPRAIRFPRRELVFRGSELVFTRADLNQPGPWLTGRASVELVFTRLYGFVRREFTTASGSRRGIPNLGGLDFLFGYARPALRQDERRAVELLGMRREPPRVGRI